MAGNSMLRSMRRQDEERRKNEAGLHLPTIDGGQVTVEYKIVDIALIDENPDNRKIYGNNYHTDLFADTVKEKGFTNVIFVFQKEDGRYEIISGHRSLEAAKKAGYAQIGCMILPSPGNEIERRENLVERNLNSRRYTPLITANEIAYMYESEAMKLKEAGVAKDIETTIKATLAEKQGLSVSQITMYLNLYKLIPELKSLIDTDEDPDAGNAYPIKVLSTAAQYDEKQQKILYDRIKQRERMTGAKGVSSTWLKEEIDEFKYAKAGYQTEHVWDRNLGFLSDEKKEEILKAPAQESSAPEEKAAKKRRVDGAKNIAKSSDLLRIALSSDAFIKSKAKPLVRKRLIEMQELINKYLSEADQ